MLGIFVVLIIRNIDVWLFDRLFTILGVIRVRRKKVYVMFWSIKKNYFFLDVS